MNIIDVPMRVPKHYTKCLPLSTTSYKGTEVMRNLIYERTETEAKIIAQERIQSGQGSRYLK